ncbi:MAG: type II secretion system protein [Planctomycetes bacterium]|nr:type II secretion system protein [Planctomycetota bacterium]
MVRRDFTLIEVLVSITIIVILTSLLIMGLGGTKAKAMHKASLATVNKVMVALGNYQAAFRDFPPDGYDLGENGSGNGWDVNTQGVLVGYGGDQRRVRGTAALIYFLCRPVVRVTRQSADPDDTSATFTLVGPFLTLEAGDFSLERVTLNGVEQSFNPNHPWTDDAFWDVQGGIRCEIIDAFGRPLCYDKVKTDHTTQNPATNQFQFYNPSLFQDPNGSQTGGGGIYAHPDAVRYIVGGLMPISIDEEPDALGLSEDELIKYRCDPRFLDKAQFQALITGLEGGTPPGAASAATHKPKNVPGYDLWSAGRSWVDPRDDITSWGD